MNDFTKYELCSLLWAIGYVRERTNNSGDIMIALRKKIQDMIDNYCEHETENCAHETDKIKNGIIIACEGDINKPFKCKKCGEFYE